MSSAMGAAGSAEPPSDSQLRPDADWARVPPSCRPGGPSFSTELDAPEPAAPARTVTDAYDIGRRAAPAARAPPPLDPKQPNSAALGICLQARSGPSRDVPTSPLTSVT